MTGDDREPNANPQTLRGLRRRTLLTWLSFALAGVAGALAAVPVIGVVVWPLRRAAVQTWEAVGAADDFALGVTTAVAYRDPERVPWGGFTAENAAWVRRVGADRFIAFSSYCTHTGCPVRWIEGARLFLCPCHGGAFDGDGRVAAGPPPAPLPRLAVRVREGQVEVLTERLARRPLAHSLRPQRQKLGTT